jgi:hypothetical protein
MAQPRAARMGRRSWLAAGLALPLLIAHAGTLDVAFDGDTLRPAMPDLHFISGRALERLKDARTVVFLSQITLLREDHVTPFRHAPQRFYVSYDIWEGRFKVTIPGATPESRLGLTAAQAEAWCTAGGLHLAGVAGAAGLPGAPHQPAHPGVDRGAGQTGGGRSERARAGGAARRRNRARHPGLQHMADKLQESTERLVYLRQLASWQTLARKMAHEVKNSLTPIRLTVEEMLARYDDADRGFMEQATQIVVDEIETLERRIRAFSQFATEPPVRARPSGRQRAVAGAHGVPQDRASRSGLRLPAGGERVRPWWRTRICSRASSPTCWRTPPKPRARAAASWGDVGGERARLYRGARFRTGAERAGARQRCFNPPFRSRSGAWGWDFPSRARARC